MTATYAMVHDLGADLRVTALSNKAKTLLALDTAAELGRAMGCVLWQYQGACETTLRLWASSRNIPVRLVRHHDDGSLDVLRLDSDALDVSFHIDAGRVAP
jgi:hypothetical protein